MTTFLEPIFLIGGMPQVGKSTTRGLIAQYTELKGGSCSDVVYAAFAKSIGKTVAEARAMPKEEIRPKLVKMGDDLCAGDPAHLIRALHRRGIRVIDGVRRREEFTAACKEFQVIPVWVSNNRAPAIIDNTDVTRDLFTYEIDNSGTIRDLASAVWKLCQHTEPQWLSPVPDLA